MGYTFHLQDRRTQFLPFLFIVQRKNFLRHLSCPHDPLNDQITNISLISEISPKSFYATSDDAMFYPWMMQSPNQMVNHIYINSRRQVNWGLQFSTYNNQIILALLPSFRQERTLNPRVGATSVGHSHLIMVHPILKPKPSN